MAVFLLFDNAERLVQLTEAATGDFGHADPFDVFMPKDDERRHLWSAIELAPEILIRFRPPVYQAVIGHARRMDGKLQVDAIELVRERLRRQHIEAAERAMFQIAQGLALGDLAESRWYPGSTLPDHLIAGKAAMVEDLRKAHYRVEKWKEGGPVEIPSLLASHCGGELPL